jgi:hypothetical protein
MFISMNGYKAATDLDAIRKGYALGMDKRMERGLNMGELPLSHRLIHDPKTGKAVRIELDPDTRRLWEDVATLLLEGVAWRIMGQILYKRYGHATDGRRYTTRTLTRIIYNPCFWGHVARHFKGKEDLWVFDEDLPLPDGVKINRNAHQAVWSGEFAELIKAELRRRKAISGGRASPMHSYLFTGLLVCDHCGYNLSVSTNNGYPHWRCISRYSRRDTITCDAHKVINSKKVKEYVDLLLREAVRDSNFSVVRLRARVSEDPQTEHVADLNKEVDGLQQQIYMLISQQMAATSPSVVEIYAARIAEAGERLEILKHNLAQAQAKIETPAQAKARVQSFEELSRRGVDFLWRMEPYQINQFLHRVFGNLRLVVRDGEILSIEPRRR